MGSSTALIVETIMALIVLMSKHQNAKAISEEQIDGELKRVFEEFKKRDPSKLPDV